MIACNIKRTEKDPKWGTCVFLFNPDNPEQLLLFKRAEGERQEPGSWGFAGGKVDYGETAAEAIVREVKEETGLDLVHYKFIGAFTKDDYLDFVFVSIMWCGEIVLKPDECEAYTLATLDEIHKQEIAGEPVDIFSFTKSSVQFYDEWLKSGQEFI